MRSALCCEVPRIHWWEGEHEGVGLAPPRFLDLAASVRTSEAKELRERGNTILGLDAL